MFGIPLEDLAVLAAVLLAGGAATGLLAGLLGIGGGAIIVPVLYYLFGILGVPEDIRMHLCVGTSLAIIIPTSIRSFLAHKRRGAVDMSVLKRWAVPILIGVCTGTLIAAISPAQVLEVVFGLFGVTLGSQMLIFGSKAVRRYDDLPGPLGTSLYGWLLGLISSLVGIGGGALATLVLVVYGRSILQGIAIGAGVGVLVSIPGTVGFMIAGWPEMGRLPVFSVGYVSLIGALLIAPVSMLVAPLGVRIAHAFTPRQLEIVLGLFLITMGSRFLVSVLIERFS